MGELLLENMNWCDIICIGSNHYEKNTWNKFRTQKIKVTTESFNKINKGANYKGHYYTKLIIILRDMKNIIKKAVEQI